MIHQISYRLAFAALLCLAAPQAMAQDVMVRPSENNTPPVQGGSTWFNIFSPTKKSAEPAPSPGTTIPQPSGASSAPPVDISKLPPEVQKEYSNALSQREKLKVGAGNPASALKAFQEMDTPKFPDISGLNMSPEAKAAYIKNTNKVIESINASKERYNSLKPFEINMPEPDRRMNNHKFERQLNVVMAGNPTFTTADIAAVSDNFDIPKNAVQELCELRIYGVAKTSDTMVDAGEEVRGGQAVLYYDGDAPTVNFDISARCRLNNISENVILRVKEKGMYLHRLGIAECRPTQGAGVSGTVKVTYLGGGQVSCAF